MHDKTILTGPLMNYLMIPKDLVACVGEHWNDYFSETLHEKAVRELYDQYLEDNPGGSNVILWLKASMRICLDEQLSAGPWWCGICGEGGNYEGERPADYWFPPESHQCAERVETPKRGVASRAGVLTAAWEHTTPLTRAYAETVLANGFAGDKVNEFETKGPYSTLDRLIRELNARPEDEPFPEFTAVWDGLSPEARYMMIEKEKDDK